MKVGKKKIPINWDKIAGMAIAGAKSTVIANVLGYSYRTLQDRAVTDHGITLVAFMEKEREEIKAQLVSTAIELARVDPKMMEFVLGTVFGMKDTEWKKEQDSERNRINRETYKLKAKTAKESHELAVKKFESDEKIAKDRLDLDAKRIAIDLEKYKMNNQSDEKEINITMIESKKPEGWGDSFVDN